MWFLIGIGILLVIGAWVLGSGAFNFDAVDEKTLAGTLNQIGWLLIYVGIALTVILIILVIAGVSVGVLLGMK